MVQTAQTVVHFAHFQVQAQLAARHVLTVPMHAVKFLYIPTFHWGLKVATHCCVLVHLCFIQDQSDTIETTRYNCSHVASQCNACCQVSVYRHLSLGPQDCNPVLQTDVSALILQWLGPCSIIAQLTVNPLLGAACLLGAVYIPSLLKHKSQHPVDAAVLSKITSKPIPKIPRKSKRNAARLLP